MSSEGAPSVNNIPATVIYAPLLATARYATGVVLTNSTPQHVAIVDGDGSQITSFGGGTQYTEGDTDATITGTAMMMEGAGNALVPAQGTASDGLLVNLGTNNDVTLATLTTLTGGGVAHDSADSGNPHKIGYKAFSPDGTTPGTAVAENDRTDAKGDLDGRLFVNTTHPRFGHKHLDGTAAYTDEALVADPGDGFQIIITSIIFSSGEAVAINFFLEEGSTKIFGPIYIEATAGRGFVSGPIFLPITASTAVTLTTSAANDQSFDMDYFVQAV